jgi:hypothetical protein
MREIKISIPCEEKTCGNCQTLRNHRFGDGQELNLPYCQIFGKYMWDGWTHKQITERLPECINSEI